MGAYLRGKLEELKKRRRIIGYISGMGLLLAVFLRKDGKTPFDPNMDVGGFIRDYCYKNGVILRNNGDILVFAPALIITRDQIDEIINVVDKALQSAVKHFGL